MTPTMAVVESATASRTIVDATGRRIELRQMNALDKLRLFKAAGTALSQNEMWLGMALLACSVTAIDGVPVPQPGNETQIEALVARLGDAGLAVVGDALEQMERERTPNEGLAALGN
jgi:hypothetical protein